MDAQDVQFGGERTAGVCVCVCVCVCMGVHLQLFLLLFQIGYNHTV